MTLVLDPIDLPMASARQVPWGTMVSAGCHVVALVVLALVVRPAMEPPPVPSVAVDLISVEQFEALTRPPAPVVTTPVPDVEPAVPAPPAEGTETTDPARLPVEQQGKGTITATEFFAGSLLDEPESAGLKRALTKVEPGERLVQLCGIEAMAQVRRARPEYDPDMVVAYAMAETVMHDGRLVADGAAFRSRREWYGMTYECAASADFVRVTAFEFSVGEFIPHEEWEAHYLTVEEVGD